MIAPAVVEIFSVPLFAYLHRTYKPFDGGTNSGTSVYQAFNSRNSILQKKTSPRGKCLGGRPDALLTPHPTCSRIV